jgi:hypothetical protein
MHAALSRPEPANLHTPTCGCETPGSRSQASVCAAVVNGDEGPRLDEGPARGFCQHQPLGKLLPNALPNWVNSFRSPQPRVDVPLDVGEVPEIERPEDVACALGLKPQKRLEPRIGDPAV